MGVGLRHNNIQPMSVEEAFYSLVYTPYDKQSRERGSSGLWVSLSSSHHPPVYAVAGPRGPIVFHLQCVESNVWFCMLR